MIRDLPAGVRALLVRELAQALAAEHRRLTCSMEAIDIDLTTASREDLDQEGATAGALARDRGGDEGRNPGINQARRPTSLILARVLVAAVAAPRGNHQDDARSAA